MKQWSHFYLRRAHEVLGIYSDLGSALGVMNREFPFRVTRHSLGNAFKRNGMGAPGNYLAGRSAPEAAVEVPYYTDDDREPSTEPRPWSSGPGPAPQPPPEVRVEGEAGSQPARPGNRRKKALEVIERFKPLYAVIRKGPLHFRELCDKLDMSPVKAQKLVDAAAKAGIEVSVVHNHIGIDTAPTQHVQDTHIAPLKGARQKIAVISDTHLGSKYCMREQLKDFISYAYNQGVRTILHPGDVLDGAYHHGVFELTHTGIEDQTQDLIETLPQLDGLTYHAITGNHDETFWKNSGVNVGRVIEAHFQDAGRHDIRFYGDRDAFLKVHGIVVHLWHPTGGGSYARSYGVQKKVESYTALKPQLLLTGHWHQYCHIFERGVHAIACPTFQGSMSRFSRSLKGTQAQGGLLLSWDLTTHGTIRNFILEKRTYYENERPVEIYNHHDGQEVPKQVTRPAPVAAGVHRWHPKP